MKKIGLALVLLGCLGIHRIALAQVPANCPTVCDQKYALCIAASCDPKTGKCGRCDKSDGSCGYCYVFEGKSCSYGKNITCSQLKPSGKTVYSTYSERLSTDFGLKVLTCPNAQYSADCMDGKCTLTGQTVTLTNNEGKKVKVPTAICQCKVAQGPGGGMTLGGQCNSANCSATWSVAIGVLESIPHCQ
jgi:hypothetical protein